jgi:hypothetical protein
MVTHTYNPIMQRQEDQEFGASLGYIKKPCLKKHSAKQNKATQRMWRCPETTKFEDCCCNEIHLSHDARDYLQGNEREKQLIIFIVHIITEKF